MQKKIIGLFIACTIFFSGCGSYDVLDKVADTSTPAEEVSPTAALTVIPTETPAEEPITSSQSPDETPEISEKEIIGSRPEYDPLDYVDISGADISNIKIEGQVSDEEVDDFIHSQMVDMKVFDGDENADKGDIVNIDYTATAEGESEPFVDVQSEDRFVGSNTFPDEIDKKLLNTKAGDEIETTYSFPENYSDEAYKGKTFFYHIKINEVKGMKLTNEVATIISNGTEENASDYWNYVKECLVYKKKEQESLAAVNQLCDLCKITGYPQDVLAYDVSRQFVSSYETSKTEEIEDLDEYVKENGYDDIEELAETIKKNAEKDLEKEMKVLALAKNYDLWLTEDELSERIMKTVTGYQSAEDYYSAFSEAYARYTIAKIDLAKEILNYEK